jgi:hypothetical protein
MGTYGLKGVMTMWKAGKLTNEQAIGQILQLLEIIEMRLNELERRARSERVRQVADEGGEMPSLEE